MVTRKILPAVVFLVALSLFAGGCGFNRAWSRDYFNGTVSVNQAVKDINNYKVSFGKVTGDPERLKFHSEGTLPGLGNIWMNDSDVFLCFETDNGKVTSIILIYFQGIPFAVEGAKDVTLKIAEMIDPADYILAPENKSALIEHLNFAGDDLYIRTFENSNDTRIEKLSQNIIIGSVGVIRFSDKYGTDLSEWRKNFLLQTVREFENALGQFNLPR